MSQTDPATPTRKSSFTINWVWPEIGDQDSTDLLAFWKEQGAIPDEDQARKRLTQVLFLARDDQGHIAGVCTALPVNPPQLGQPVYYWRAFIAPPYRASRLIGTLLSKSCDALADYARDNDFPCIGILLELENDRFRKAGRKAEWYHPRFAYIGKSPRGLDVRIHYFRGARLKKA